MTSLQNLPFFLTYFASSVVLLAIFLVIYARLTQHDEWALLRAGNAAAAISLLGATAGFTLPLAAVVAHAADLLDLAIWAAVAMVVQLLGYFLLYALRHDISRAIARGEMAAGALLGGGSLILGILNAACLTY